jgi:membrane protease YdiL (CAAX protease family)
MVRLSISQLSSLSPKNWPPEAFAWWKSLAVLLVLAGAFVAWGAITLQFVRGTGTSIGELQRITLKLTWTIALAQLSTYVPVLLTLLTLLPWLSGRSLRALGLRSLTVRDVAIACLGVVAMYAVTIAAAAIGYAITHQASKEQAVALFTSTKDPLLVLAFAIVATVAAPFAEELVFRAFLFNAFLRYMPIAAAALISGLLFGLAHVLGSTWSVLPPLAASGIVLAYVYALSGSLTATILTHALFNIANVLLITARHA